MQLMRTKVITKSHGIIVTYSTAVFTNLSFTGFGSSRRFLTQTDIDTTVACKWRHPTHLHPCHMIPTEVLHLIPKRHDARVWNEFLMLGERWLTGGDTVRLMGDDIKMGKGQSGEKGLKERAAIIGNRRGQVCNRQFTANKSIFY